MKNELSPFRSVGELSPYRSKDNCNCIDSEQMIDDEMKLCGNDKMQILFSLTEMVTDEFWKKKIELEKEWETFEVIESEVNELQTKYMRKEKITFLHNNINAPSDMDHVDELADLKNKLDDLLVIHLKAMEPVKSVLSLRSRIYEIEKLTDLAWYQMFPALT